MSAPRRWQGWLAVFAIAVPAYGGAQTDAAAIERGRTLFAESTDAQCILCHRHAAVTAPFQGTLGPDLTRVAQRRSLTALRALIEDPTQQNPETAMPAYFRRTNLRQVQAQYRDRTILTAGQIDDLLAFLTAP